MQGQSGLRSKLLVAAFLGTTFLTPKPAEAAPVVGFIAGAIGVPGLATSLGIVQGVAAGAIFGATPIGGLIIKTVVAVGLSKLAAKLQPNAALSGAKPSNRLVNFSQPISYAEYVYGRTRKGGPIGYKGFKNSRRYYVPILAAHEIDGFVEHWLDERVVTLNANSNQNQSNIDTAPIKGYGRINPFLGAPGQVADPGLTAAFTEITSAHDFKGLAGGVIWAKRPPDANFTKIYPNGRQWAWAPVIDGKKDIYDPRDQSTGYTNNAALVLADWLTDYLGHEVDWDEVAEEADAADEQVINKQGQNQPRWTLNGTISDEQQFEDQRAQMAAACDAFIFERTDGKVGFKVGRWIEPTLTLTADDFFAFELSEGRWGADAPDEVSIQYTDPDNAYRETPSGTWVENAVAKAKRDEPQLFMINTHNQASRLAKRIARTKGAQYQLRGTLGFKGYELLGGAENGSAHRFFRVVHDEMDIDQVFEIGELSREGVGMFSIEANSVEKADFDFNAATEEPERPRFSSVVNDDSLPVLTGMIGGAISSTSIRLVWTGQDTAYQPEVWYRKAGTTDWETRKLDGGSQTVRIDMLESGATYQAQVRNTKSGIGISDWHPSSPLEVVTTVDPTIPAALVSFTSGFEGLAPKVIFTAPNDAAYFGTKIYRALDSANFANATLIQTEFGLPNQADSWVDEDQILQVGSLVESVSYWGEPINASGSSGAQSGPVTINL